jgi:inner membrane protein
MMAPSHVIFGLATYQGICSFYGYQPEWWYFICAGIGSLLPDIDHPKSQVGRMIPTLSKFMAQTFGHRGFTHSLMAVVIFMWIMFQTSSLALGATAAFCLGYLSHIWADFHSKSGVPLLWPARIKVRSPILVYTTNGPGEYLLTLGLIGILAYVWVY